MAKQKSVLQFRGKLGQVVGMKNGFGGTEGFARAYVADPKNPQSSAQTAQRIRLLPAVNFRRQLQSVISRAWEGTKYGGASMRKFMKYALKEPLANIPQLVKDESLAIPGKYLVSRGSLAPITTEFTINTMVFGLPCGDFAIASTTKGTLGYLSRQLIQFGNGTLQNGDQLTIICCYSNNPSSAQLTNVIYAIVSIVLDVDSDVMVSEIDNGFTVADEALAFSRQARLLGGCIVLSREGSANLRSTTRMEINENDAQLMAYFSRSLKEEVKRSYAKSTNSSSLDWPYEASDDEASDGPFTVSVVSSDATLGTVAGGGSFYRGDIATCVATPVGEAYFVEWQINGERVSTLESYQHEVTGPVRIEAIFEEEDRP